MSTVYLNPRSYNNLSLYDQYFLEELSSAEGSKVVYFCAEIYDRDLRPNVDYLPVFNYLRYSPVLKAISYLSSLAKVIAFLIAHHSEIDHLHYQWPLLSWFQVPIFAFIGKFLRIRTTLVIHNLFPHNRESLSAEALLALMTPTSSIVVHTQYDKAILSLAYQKYSFKVAVVPHPPLRLASCPLSYPFLSAGTINSCPSYRRLCNIKKRRLAERNGVVTVLFFGRFSAYKGLDTLLNEWTLYSQESHSKSLQLIIASKISSHRLCAEIFRVKTIYSNVVHEDRFLLEEELSSLIEYANYLIFPYGRISQSGALMTGIGHSKPIISSNIPPFLEVSQQFPFHPFFFFDPMVRGSLSNVFKSIEVS